MALAVRMKMISANDKVLEKIIIEKCFKGFKCNENAEKKDNTNW